MSSKNCIKVYARLKPEKSKHLLNYNITKNSPVQEIIFSIPNNCGDVSRYDGNKFRFHQILNETIEQAKVFESVVQPVIDNVLEGYNGTILTYGQTGSGKTFTMTGSTEDYDNRGIIPRSIQYIFDIIRKSPDNLYSVYISYLEIYNEFGYDLLDEREGASKLEDLQKVTALEDNQGNMHLRNLSVLPVTAETDALRLLFLGDTNRTIAETAMNPFSTRSHCIFTIHIGIRHPTSKTVRRGKLHLVDLAGSVILILSGGVHLLIVSEYQLINYHLISERLAKSSPSVTKTITEAKHINLSLHYLEQVIVALSESRRQHIPYRNSLLTSVLRDSLGGNCLTCLVATLSLKSVNFLETISTCRFAERVALISNELKVNEETDPQLEVTALKSEIELLRNQLSMFTNNNDVTKKLTEIQEQKCKEAVHKYIQGLTVELEVEPNYQNIKYCFQLFKNIIVTESLQRRMAMSSAKKKKEIAQLGVPQTDNNETMENYKQIIKQRDSEISILINLLRKEKDKSVSIIEPCSIASPPSTRPNSAKYDDDLHINSTRSDEFQNVNSRLSSPKSIDAQERQFNHIEKAAYEAFIRNPKNFREVKNCRALLKEKLTTARKLAANIELIKSKIMSIQKEFKTVSTNTDSLKVMVHLKQQLTEQRCMYKEKISVLRELKTATDHVKHGLESAHIRLLNRFKEWYKNETLQKIPCRESNGKSPKSKVYKSPRKKRVCSPVTVNKIENENKTVNSTIREVVPQSIFSKNTLVTNITEQLQHFTNDTTSHAKILTEPTIDNKMYTWDEFIKSEPVYKGDVNRTVSTSSFVYDESTAQEDSGGKIKVHKKIGRHLESSDTMVDVQSDILSTSSEEEESRDGSGHDNMEVIYKNPNVKVKSSSKPQTPLTNKTAPTTSMAETSSTSKNWDEFVKSLPLTGDAEVDTEIIKFYKGSFGIK